MFTKLDIYDNNRKIEKHLSIDVLEKRCSEKHLWMAASQNRNELDRDA